MINDAIAYRLRSHGDEGVGYLRVGSDPLRQLKFFNTRAKYVAPVVAAERGGEFGGLVHAARVHRGAGC